MAIGDEEIRQAITVLVTKANEADEADKLGIKTLLNRLREYFEEERGVVTEKEFWKDSARREWIKVVAAEEIEKLWVEEEKADELQRATGVKGKEKGSQQKKEDGKPGKDAKKDVEKPPKSRPSKPKKASKTIESDSEEIKDDAVDDDGEAGEKGSDEPAAVKPSKKRPSEEGGSDEDELKKKRRKKEDKQVYKSAELINSEGDPIIDEGYAERNDDDDDDDTSSKLKRKRVPRKERDNKPAGKTPKAKKPKADENLSKEEEEIKRLKSFVVACGVRKQWGKELAGMSGRESINHLNKMLRELGMPSRLSMQAAKEIKARRELAKEMEELGAADMDLDNDRPTRRAAAVRSKPLIQRYVEVEQGEGQDSDDDVAEPNATMNRGPIKFRNVTTIESSEDEDE